VIVVCMVIRNWVGCLLFIVNTPVFAFDVIEWFTDDKKDVEYFSTNGTYSIGADTLKLVLDSISEFEVHLKYASISRINTQLRTTPNSCVANRIKTQSRETENVFSLPLNIHPLARLYFLENNIIIPSNLLNDKGELLNILALSEVNPEKTLGLTRGVSYGEAIDEQVKVLSQKNLVYFNSDDRYSMGMKLLSDNLVDLNLAYPSQMQALSRSDKINRRVVSLPVHQKNQFLITHIACSDSSFGKKVIEVINKKLIQLYGSDKHKQAHLTHIPLPDHPSFIRDYQNFFTPLKIPSN